MEERREQENVKSRKKVAMSEKELLGFPRSWWPFLILFWGLCGFIGWNLRY